MKDYQHKTIENYLNVINDLEVAKKKKDKFSIKRMYDNNIEHLEKQLSTYKNKITTK